MEVSMSKKILDYAKDRNDFFCAHEIGSFFNNYDFAKLSAIISNLKGQGKLTMTDASEPCKMQTKRHHFYIYNNNKKQNGATQKIDEDGNENYKPKISKNHKNMNLFGDIKNAVKNQKGEFCRHMIAKEVNKSPKEVASYLRLLKEKRKLKYIGKKNCPNGQRAHKFYVLVNKNLNNVKRSNIPTMQVWRDRIPEVNKLIAEGLTDLEIARKFDVLPRSIERMRHRYGLLKRRPLTKAVRIKAVKQENTQTSDEADSGVFIKCLSCNFEYIAGKANIMNEGYTTCPRCQHKIKV